LFSLSCPPLTRALAAIAGAFLITSGIASTASAATSASSVQTSVQAEVAKAKAAHEYAIVAKSGGTAYTVELFGPGGRSVQATKIDSSTAMAFVAAWRATSPATVKPFGVDRISCSGAGSAGSTQVWNYNYTGELCFGVGAGNVKVYNINEIDSRDYTVAYTVSGGPTSGTLQYINGGSYALFSASDNVELTYLNVY
jgi:hypothetical protein